MAAVGSNPGPLDPESELGHRAPAHNIGILIEH